MSNDILTQIAELEAQIATFPVGSIGQKQVNGKTYYYHRFKEDGKRKEKYIPESEVAALREQIDQRKALEKQLKDLKKLAPKKKAATNTHDFITDVRIGDTLRAYSNAVRKYKKRSHYQRLHDYVYGNTYGRVFILFGLRRTGKTTLIRQIVFCQVKIPGFAKANSLVLPREIPGNCQINSLVLPRYFTRMRALRRR